MSRSSKIVIFVLSIILMFVATMILCMYDCVNYAFITICLGLILIISLFIYLRKTRSPQDIFYSTLKDILKTYDAVLVNSFEIPDFKDKSIIKVTNFDDLMDAQIEIRKPVYYKRDVDYCDFILLDSNEVCLYSLKLTEDVESAIDKRLKSMEKQEQNIDHSILDDIDKTTLIKLDNNKTYKVSPVKNKEKTMIKDFAEWKEEFLPKLKEK